MIFEQLQPTSGDGDNCYILKLIKSVENVNIHKLLCHCWLSPSANKAAEIMNCVH